MKRLSSRRTTKYAALLLALVTGAVIVVASAQATPTKKNVNVFVYQSNSQSNCATNTGTCFEVFVQNDTSSNVTLGSTNVTAPSGWTINSLTVADASGHNWSGSCVGDGTTCNAGTGVVQLRANTSGDSLVAGESVTAFADVTTNCSASPDGTSALWQQETKQANNFSGQPGNDFAGKTLDLNPLGSFSVTTDIPSVVDRSATPSVTWTVTAKDTCGVTKAAGARPGQAAYRGTNPYQDSLSHTGLTGASYNPASGLSWGTSNGVGTVTVTPNTSEAGNQLIETDTTTGISTSSTTFVVVDELCTKTNGKPCSVNDGQYHNGSVTTTLSTPNGTNPNQGSLGLGFDPSLDTTGCVQGVGQLGEKMFIFPSGIVGTYQVTITLTKAALNKAQTSSLYICFKSDNPNVSPATNGWIVLQNCSNTVSDPCIVSRSGTSGGGVQFVLSLAPGDPSPVIHH
jgi:hypothetical protein